MMLANQFRAKWGNEPRFNTIGGYLVSRAMAIDERMKQTFRYVEPSPDNKKAFSYEFSSILRDCGSVFDSSMRELLTLAKYPTARKEYDIRDYRSFLLQYADRQTLPPAGMGIESVVVQINSQFVGQYLMPLSSLANEGSPLEWWDAYNDVKHLDLEKTAQGNLGNCLNAFGAVAILYALIAFPGRWSQTLGPPTFYDPMDEIKRQLF